MDAPPKSICDTLLAEVFVEHFRDHKRSTLGATRVNRPLSGYQYLLGIMLLSSAAYCQIFQLAELNTSQIHALDRARTVVLIPGGILEEHGPYLPSFTDGYVTQAYTESLARAIVARPGWTVVVLP